VEEKEEEEVEVWRISAVASAGCTVLAVPSTAVISDLWRAYGRV